MSILVVKLKLLGLSRHPLCPSYPMSFKVNPPQLYKHRRHTPPQEYHTPHK
jgi:hypothetical protein